uniref:Uncharacterized protein n=1 Tax=Noctiluca scintillans TaxID=2966 RepID=A0A7S1A372_NOCSC|mmetsp:Transcript_29767/g.79108  ORF Transcript_29767/g.79108 Transcript_29767/m.79108 type:complete len:278 (+) Transcript_29767:112-945(+)
MLGPRRRGVHAHTGKQQQQHQQQPQAEQRSQSEVEERRSLSGSRARSEASPGRKKPGKRKAFAWMDSGDESGGGSDSSEQVKDREKQVKDRAAACSEDRWKVSQRDRDARPLLARVAEVETFSDMVRLAPELQRRAPRMLPAELAAAVTAAARVKFYDAEAFQSGLLPTARRHLQRTSSSFTTDEAVDLVSGLAALNVYDKPIFSKVVEAFVEKRAELEDGTRRVRLLTAFRAVKHEDDKDFIAYLVQREKTERYEQRLLEQQGLAGPQIYYGGLRK